ncbi:hypothetical protein GF322_02475 [Candidatus Dependentiae bacterium]|nr:hypothetical protein [Candidatus Dependentiae bacterium]
MKKLKLILIMNLYYIFTTQLIGCFNYTDYNQKHKSIPIAKLQKYINQICFNCIKTSGYNPHTKNFPNKLLPEYQLKVDQTLQEVKNYMQVNYKSYISQKKLKRIAEKNLKKLKQTLSKITLEYKIEYKVSQLIEKLSILYSIPKSEYLHKKKIIIKTLKQLMREDNRNYIHRNEIKKQIRKHFENYLKENDTFWINYFYPLYNQYTSNNFIYDSNLEINSSPQKIKYDELYDTIIKISTELLGITPEKLPARVVSDYTEKIQRIKSQILSSIPLYQTFVTIDEVKNIAKKELQNVLDKINYKNEICPICQELFKTGDKVGILSCNDNHFFHKDCIYQWLNIDAKKSCPICLKEKIIVAKIENVPYPRLL